jgi:hypothetical protein
MLALLLIALPAFARDLPLACQESERFASGAADTELARCRPTDTATAAQWALKLGEAMGRNGLHPTVTHGPLGLHVASLTDEGMVSATFVTAGAKFDIWISEEHFAAHASDEPVLPKGATIVGDQNDDRHRLLTVALAVPFRESAALVGATLAELGAERLTHENAKGGEVGRVRWLGREGMYQLRGDGAHATYLVMFVGQRR